MLPLRVHDTKTQTFKKRSNCIPFTNEDIRDCAIHTHVVHAAAFKQAIGKLSGTMLITPLHVNVVYSISSYLRSYLVNCFVFY